MIRTAYYFKLSITMTSTTRPARHLGLAFRWREGAFALRLLVAAAVAYGVVEALHLGRGYSAILSALIVVRPYQDGALKAGLLRLLATAVGLTLAFGASILQQQGVDNLVLLFATLTPLSVLAAYDASYRTALITAVILLSASSGGATNVEVAIARALAVGIGAAVGVLVTLVVLPTPHHHTIGDHALKAMDALLKLAAASLEGGRKPAWIERQDQRLRRVLFDLGRAAKDGKPGDPESKSAMINGLVRRAQAQLLLLRSGWRRPELDDEARTARVAVLQALEAALPRSATDDERMAAVKRAFGGLRRLEPARPAEEFPEAWLLESLARDVAALGELAG